MKQILITLLIVFGVIIVIGLGSVLLVLWAYGAGQVMLRILPSDTFTPFEATLLNQVGVLIVGLIVARAVSSAISNNPIISKPMRDDNKDKGRRDEAEEIENDAENDTDEFAGIPPWRRPLKKIDFTNVKPNDPCPCGSGRKFQNCHGYKRSDAK